MGTQAFLNESMGRNATKELLLIRKIMENCHGSNKCDKERMDFSSPN